MTAGGAGGPLECEETACCRLNGYKEDTGGGSCPVMCCNKLLIIPLLAAMSLPKLQIAVAHFMHSLHTACLIMIMFLPVLSPPLPLLFTSFSLTALSLQTRGSIVFPKMPWSLRPSMPVHSVCVCVCIPFRKQLSHSAITCCTAETDRYCPRQLSLSLLYLSFINNSTTDFSKLGHYSFLNPNYSDCCHTPNSPLFRHCSTLPRHPFCPDRVGV